VLIRKPSLGDVLIKRPGQGWHRGILFAVCIFVFAGSSAFAEQTQTIPLQMNPLSYNFQSIRPVESSVEIPRGEETPVAERKKVLPAAGLSLVEQYVSGVIEITDTQYEMLKKNDSLSFSYKAPLP
jgi:hypothetical protein